MLSLTRRMIWLTLFSVAMGFLETAVVIYLRKLYYPAGFNFPLVPVPNDVAMVEFLREAATIIMLAGIGILTGKNTSQKFAIFLYCFAVWDIFYYVFLKIFLGWPESLLTWDILFIIPVPWVGPVICPCITSLTMIVLTACVICFQERGYNAHLKAREWILLITGSLITIYSFTLDYFKYASRNNSSSGALFSDISHYVPATFNWWIYLIGEVVIVLGIISFVCRVLKQKAIGF